MYHDSCFQVSKIDTNSECDERNFKFHLKQDLLFLAYVMRLPKSPTKSALRPLLHLRSGILFHHIAKDQTPLQLPLEKLFINSVVNFKSETNLYPWMMSLTTCDNSLFSKSPNCNKIILATSLQTRNKSADCLFIVVLSDLPKYICHQGSMLHKIALHNKIHKYHGF